MDATRRALQRFPSGIIEEQAAVMALADLQGSPLDPYSFDDAALLLRAERLLHDGLSVAHALGTAREELATFAIGAQQ
jgi:hypothetical protein